MIGLDFVCASCCLFAVWDRYLYFDFVAGLGLEMSVFCVYILVLVWWSVLLGILFLLHMLLLILQIRILLMGLFELSFVV